MNERARILVVDDELGLREACKRVLAAQGFSVDAAENGAEGLRKVQTGGYDLVLLDAGCRTSTALTFSSPSTSLTPRPSASSSPATAP